MTSTNNSDAIHTAANIVQQGGVIAYPTEAVFGFGCDPLNENAVRRILKIKNRSEKKGLILIASAWEQIEKFTIPVEEELFTKVNKTWPGPVTWLFPASQHAPQWLTGDHDTIALRITDHPIAKALCDQLGGALVSTSVNREGEKPLRTADEAKEAFAHEVDFVVPGNVGGSETPTIIRDVRTGTIIRE